jgi:hypothetical protein
LKRPHNVDNMTTNKLREAYSCNLSPPLPFCGVKPVLTSRFLAVTSSLLSRSRHHPCNPSRSNILNNLVYLFWLICRNCPIDVISRSNILNNPFVSFGFANEGPGGYGVRMCATSNAVRAVRTIYQALLQTSVSFRE